MAGLIAQGFIDDLLNRTDIVEVVSSRVQFKKVRKELHCLLPFSPRENPLFQRQP